MQAMLTHYSVNAVTQGPEALATTRVSLTQRGRNTDDDLVTSAQVNPPPPPPPPHSDNEVYPFLFPA